MTKTKRMSQRMAEMHEEYAAMYSDVACIGQMIEEVQRDVMGGELFRAGLRLGMAYHVSTRARKRPEVYYDLINAVRKLEGLE